MQQTDDLPQEFGELRARLDGLPTHVRSQVLPLCDKLGHFLRLQMRLVGIAHDALHQHQLDVTYLLFDVAATRRERDALLARIDEQAADDYGDGDDEVVDEDDDVDDY